MKDPRVRKPQPFQVPPAAVGEGPQYGWRSKEQEPPITRGGALRWILVGVLAAVMVSAVAIFGVSLYVVITDPGARVPILTALISAVTTLLSGCLLQLWRLHEKSRGRMPPRRTPRRKK